MHFQVLFATLAILSSTALALPIGPEQTQAVTAFPDPPSFPSAPVPVESVSVTDDTASVAFDSDFGPPASPADPVDPAITVMGSSGSFGGGGGDFGSGFAKKRGIVGDGGLPGIFAQPPPTLAERRVPPKETYRGDERAPTIAVDPPTKTATATTHSTFHPPGGGTDAVARDVGEEEKEGRYPLSETYSGDKRAIAITEDGGTRTVRSVVEPSTSGERELGKRQDSGLGGQDWLPRPGKPNPDGSTTDETHPVIARPTPTAQEPDINAAPGVVWIPVEDLEPDRPDPSATDQWQDIKPAPTVGWIPIDGGVPADAGGVGGGQASPDTADNYNWNAEVSGGDEWWNGDDDNGNGNEWGWKRAAAIATAKSAQ
ncbi:hypothetical protein IAT40_006069 [Kwoniella sp. CBS 6097]